MSHGVLVCGGRPDLDRIAGAMARRAPDIECAMCATLWEMAQRSREADYSAALLLEGSVLEHDRRVETVAALRRDGFRGRIIAAGSFLTERDEMLAAGADYVFDPRRQDVCAVVAVALFRPRLAVDHPYLKHLFVGEWADIASYSRDVPAEAPEVLLAATSLHASPEFWGALGVFSAAHAATHCVVVEDDDNEDTHAAAMSSGVHPYVALRDTGLLELHALVRRLLREAWLARVTAA